MITLLSRTSMLTLLSSPSSLLRKRTAADTAKPHTKRLNASGVAAVSSWDGADDGAEQRSGGEIAAADSRRHVRVLFPNGLAVDDYLLSSSGKHSDFIRTLLSCSDSSRTPVELDSATLFGQGQGSATLCRQLFAMLRCCNPAQRMQRALECGRNSPSDFWVLLRALNYLHCTSDLQTLVSTRSSCMTYLDRFLSPEAVPLVVHLMQRFHSATHFPIQRLLPILAEVLFRLPLARLQQLDAGTIQLSLVALQPVVCYHRLELARCKKQILKQRVVHKQVDPEAEDSRKERMSMYRRCAELQQDKARLEQENRQLQQRAAHLLRRHDEAAVGQSRFKQQLDDLQNRYHTLAAANQELQQIILGHI